MGQRPRGHITDTVLLIIFALIGIAVLILGQPYLLSRGRTLQVAGKATTIATVAPVGPTSPLEGPTTIVLPTTKPNETGIPTPVPSVSLPRMTAVPTASGPMPTETPPADQTPSTPLPDAPFNQTVFGSRFPNTTVSVNEATFIIIGIVQTELPARWSTSNGQRPPNPHVEGASIFRPVEITVEQTLAGTVSTPQITLAAFGGVVGQDSMTYTSDDLFTFHTGERVLVFGVQRGSLSDGNPRWDVAERYTLTADGLAQNSLRTVKVSQLLNEIHVALAQTAATTVPVNR